MSSSKEYRRELYRVLKKLLKAVGLFREAYLEYLRLAEDKEYNKALKKSKRLRRLVTTINALSLEILAETLNYYSSEYRIIPLEKYLRGLDE